VGLIANFAANVRDYGQVTNPYSEKLMIELIVKIYVWLEGKLGVQRKLGPTSAVTVLPTPPPGACLIWARTRRTGVVEKSGCSRIYAKGSTFYIGVLLYQHMRPGSASRMSIYFGREILQIALRRRGAVHICFLYR
jgi:hypothetical protein